MEIRNTISTFPTLLLRRCLTPLRVCETDQCVCERSKPALLKSVWKCELLEFDCLCRPATRGLHYGQELVSTNRPDTFAQTKPPTTTILLAIWQRTIQFPWPALRGKCWIGQKNVARSRSLVQEIKDLTSIGADASSILSAYPLRRRLLAK